ncbi:MAG: nucleotidyl transferase, partial [candidate division Zixibacteria bacterium]|nr:nucleotidyl transferase [candidate division Zixibacteria bacterium]
VKDYVTSRYDLDVRFVYQAELKGLGFAIHLALQDIEGNDPILIILGDTILEIDLNTFMDGDDDAIGVKEVEDPRRFGVVETENGLATRLVEKPEHPQSNLAVIGLYGIKDTQLLRDSLSEVIKRNQTAAGELQMTDALQLMVDRGCKMQAKHVSGWFDCGKRETLLETNRHLLEKHTETYHPPESIVIPPSYISPSAQVQRSIIGPHVSIGDGSRVRDSIVSNSIISDGADVRRCVLHDSLVGSNAIVTGNAQQLNVGDSSEVGLNN